MCEKSTLGRPFGRCFDPLGRQVAPKIDKIGALGPLGRPWAARSAPGRFQDALGHQPGNSNVDILAEMVAPRVEFGALAVPRGAPKSHFLAAEQHKIAKTSLQDGFQNKHEQLIEKSLEND